MQKIYILVDYKDRFELKWKSNPYLSGFNKQFLAKSFEKYGFEVEYIPIANVFPLSRDFQGQIVLYNSNEEIGNNYKTFIEDIIFGLQAAGAYVLPRADFLRAHNNKVFMEILREILLGEGLAGLRSFCFGTLEELNQALSNGKITFPCVIKPSYGAMSKGVSNAFSADELRQKASAISRSRNIRFEVKEYLRSFKKIYKGYLPVSRFQKKFIVQPMVPNLDSDWKVLVYGDQYYPLKRHVRVGDFRASGSHFNYLAGSKSLIPETVLDFVETIYTKLDVPQLSVDVAFDGNKPFLFEFQTVHFGTSTQVEFCEDYFVKENGKWITKKKTMSLEEAYAWAITHYLRNHITLCANESKKA